MTEAFLHYIWQHQMLADGLTTTDGQPVVCLRAGEKNSNAGPDFIGARIKIGDVEWAGDVEIHVRTSDWKAHRHSQDPAYNNILLHVVYDHDCEICMQNGKVPLTLELKPYLHPSIVANYDALMTPDVDSFVPCAKRLAAVAPYIVKSTLERLVMERLEAKSEMAHRMLDENRGGWEQACCQLLAHYYGGKVNALPFELLAKATDQRLLARWKDNSERVEAILMGQAGFLEGYFEDEYPRKLQSDYESIGCGAGMVPIDRSLWKFHRLRPSSFPTIRISQFARFLSENPCPFSSFLGIVDVSELESRLNQRASSYWDTHYRFDALSSRTSVKRVGMSQAQMLIVNAWVPMLFLYGCLCGQQKYKDQAVNLLEGLPPEDNVIIRRWRHVGIQPASAAESQALLQLYNNYCVNRQCLECRIGYSILKRS
jgi:hypothetical protein